MNDTSSIVSSLGQARPIPKATDHRIRPAHAATREKPKGLDWDALKPSCKGCGERSGRLSDESLCPTCRGESTPPPGPAPFSVDPAPDPAAPQVLTKECTTCRETKPLTDFYATKAGRHGRASKCTTCHNKRPVTPTRLLRNRARNRAYALLADTHPTEFARLFETELAKAVAEHQRIKDAAAGNPDAATARLRPGPKREGQSDVTERIDVARCQTCHTHHDAAHECPTCGDVTPDQAPKVKGWEIRQWAIAEGLGPVPHTGRLPKRLINAYHEAHGLPQAGGA